MALDYHSSLPTDAEQELSPRWGERVVVAAAVALAVLVVAAIAVLMGMA